MTSNEKMLCRCYQRPGATMRRNWNNGQLSLPVAYRVSVFLKRVEHFEFYDKKTQFSPFSLPTQ